jgi:hypothetical protein
LIRRVPPPLFFSLKNHPIFNVTLFPWTTLLNGRRRHPNAEPRRHPLPPLRFTE